MIRNLKVLVLVVLAVAALGAVAASAAQAEPTFTNNAEPEDSLTYKITRDDEGGTNLKTGHMVLDIRKADGTGVLSITCKELTGHATVKASERTEATFATPKFEGQGTGTKCVFAGEDSAVENTGCNFTFTANGQIHLVDDSQFLLCEIGQKPLHFSKTNCKVEIPKQTLKGVIYHNITGGKVTVEVNNLSFEYNATGAACPYGQTKNGIFTTGNFLLSATKVESEELVEISWDE